MKGKQLLKKKRFEVQKVHFIDYIQFPEFGVHQLYNNFTYLMCFKSIKLFYQLYMEVGGGKLYTS